MDITKNIEYDKDLGVLFFEPESLLDPYIVDYSFEEEEFTLYYHDDTGEEFTEYFSLEDKEDLKIFIENHKLSSNLQEVDSFLDIIDSYILKYSEI